MLKMLINDAIKSIIKNYDNQIQKMTKSVSELVSKHPRLNNQIKLLTSIPGISNQTSISLRPSISKKGSSFIRKTLYMPTLSAIKHNPFIQQFYEKLLAKGKKKMVAITACMRKLLLIAIGVLNNNSPFSKVHINA